MHVLHPARGHLWTRLLSLLPHVPERSSPPRVRSATPKARDLDGRSESLANIREGGQMQTEQAPPFSGLTDVAYS